MGAVDLQEIERELRRCTGPWTDHGCPMIVRPEDYSEYIAGIDPPDGWVVITEYTCGPQAQDASRLLEAMADIPDFPVDGSSEDIENAFVAFWEYLPPAVSWPPGPDW